MKQPARPTPSPAPAPTSARVPPLALAIVASAAAWAVLFTAFGPGQQNFPLNDDWAFGQGAFRFAAGQGIHYLHWGSMPQLGQWLWACPFLWLFGPSFFALRVSTIVLSWLGLWAFYDLLRQEEIEPGPAALAGGALALSPLFFLLQGTFLTDVPSLSLALVALALYGRAIDGRRPVVLAVAAAVATLATLTRQNTLAVPIVVGLLLARSAELHKRTAWWLGAIVPAVAGLAAHVWFQHRADVVPTSPTAPPPDQLLLLPFAAVHLLGLAAFPVLLLAPGPGTWRRWGFAAGVLGLCAGYWFLQGDYLPYSGKGGAPPTGGLFPYTDNMLTPYGAFAGSRGTGPLVIGERPILLGAGWRLALTVLGCLAGAALLVRLPAALSRRARPRPILLFTLWQVPFLLIAPELYDRYLLALVPGALAIAVSGAPARRSRLLPALAALAVTAVLSVGLMHDWLAWNAARWEVGRRALARGIAPHEIEGGFEWDGWFRPDQPPPATAGKRPGLTLELIHRRFGHVLGRYALSFSERPEPFRLDPARFRPIRLDAEPYTLWLIPGRRQFLLIGVEPVAPPDKAKPADRP